LGTIVVGVDGSPPSLRALRFALAEAALRGANVRAVYAWNVPYAPASSAPFIGVTELPELEQSVMTHAHGLLDEALRQVDVPEGVEVEREVARGDAPHALIRSAEDAELLVVGSRGRGGFAGLLLGSVSQRCAHHAPCPVVIVPAVETPAQ
jgi:nucleotide-binding universal stress UspA family protein